MKHFIAAIAAAIIGFSSVTPSAQGQDLKGLLGNLAGGKSGNSTIDALGGIVGDLIGGKVEIRDLVGNWEYVAPAVTFQSENVLKKAGGAAAAAKVEQEMEPYYNNAGLNTLKLTVNEDETFAMTIRKMTFKGKIEKDAKGVYHFKFQALGKVKVGSMKVYMARSGKNVKLTFDVSGLITLVEKVSMFSGNSSIKALSALLSSYDGLNAGFELARVQ